VDHSIQIQTTISGEEDGVTVLEQDVILHIDYSVDDGNDLTWRVASISIEGGIWATDPETRKLRRIGDRTVTVPKPLEAALLHYMDEHKVEMLLVEELTERREMGRDDPTACLIRDYHAAVL
jgi:hypothetical protein